MLSETDPGGPMSTLLSSTSYESLIPPARGTTDSVRSRSGRQRLSTLLKPFEPITLPEMDDVRLMERSEVKYVMARAQIARILTELADDYRVLTIGPRRIHRYETLYFDTSDFTLYLAHHAGRRPRYKVRARRYTDSGLAFIEVKRKSNRDETSKKRLLTPRLTTRLEAIERAFVSEYLSDTRPLEPKLFNTFRRITLVSIRGRERVTLDLDLGYHPVAEERRSVLLLPGLVVAEVKRERGAPRTAFMERMLNHRIHPRGLSKYAVGATLLHPALKSNNLNTTHRLIRKLMYGEPHDR